MRCIWCAWMAVVCGTSPASGDEGRFTLAAVSRQVQSEAIREASGMAVSCVDPNLLWIINDSGSPAVLHLVAVDGTNRGTITLNNAGNTDWEDLASFSMDGKNYLLVADTGDNDSRRDHRILYVVEEPALPPYGGMLDGRVDVAWKIRFQYQEGPRDCEAVAVDVAAKKILLLSKRTRPPELHELPLMPGNVEVITTRKIGVVNVPAPTAGVIPFRDQPTGMDISADGSFAAVVTYYGVFVFPRQREEEWQTAFSRRAVVLDPHLLAQAESVAIARDGRSIFAVSEGLKSRIVIYQMKAD